MNQNCIVTNLPKAKRLYSLLLLQKNQNILLGLKKRGFGKGKWNGFGGKIENGETPVEAAIREMKEESGIDINIKDIERIGILDFSFVGKPEVMEVHIFTASKFEGSPVESEEMLPRWFAIEDIPYKSMWPDDKIWYPLFLNGKKFKGAVHFSEKDEMLSHSITVVETISCH